MHRDKVVWYWIDRILKEWKMIKSSVHWHNSGSLRGNLL
ncbi:Glucose-6-phosphate 1-dehydrogenase (G6PD) (fragment) [Bartonella clarridgeiae 73]|uniref:Glucose-6-phosphate 1-dehydrogenase (G6PD) n=1 Tax=Bartonella clarridgeiae (strain CCUG 45776 / CIP 104772 / 73) TaxID=696125 RepID=E6YGC9_BARC7